MYPPPAGQPPYGGPPGPPPPFVPGPPPRRGASSALIALAAIGALVLVLVAVLVVVLVRDNGPKPGPGTATPGPGTTAQPPAAGGGFPAAYAGTWTGPVIQIKPSSVRFRMTIVIEEGATTGRITATNDPTSDSVGPFTCSGTISYLHPTPRWNFKTVVLETITVETGADCDAISYSTLFPRPDNNGGSGDGMYYKNYFSQSAADADQDHNAIGELKRQSGATA
ncbi:hypothetical protein LO762_22625 [Actinocorallia sp. API 0066]|uniref:hypothetical protein n=1 Tax=Actinocorallia sp. API 0066 TaxID=2896846 RepID=UPI001E5AC539|nr:hypothetical protein [Actinocorallia sp. API 0066]MCD0451967.1 hypothetical protein [Actinocorallia sp. API 0066]